MSTHMLAAAPDAARPLWEPPIFSVLFTARDVATYLVNASSTDSAVQWIYGLGASKVYLETYRDGFTAPPYVLRDATAALRAAGLVVSGCICTTMIGEQSSTRDRTSNYLAAETQHGLARAFAYAAAHFDELIIDDWLFTTDVSAASNTSLANRQFTLYPSIFAPGGKAESRTFIPSADASCTSPRGCAWSDQRRAVMLAVAQRHILGAALSSNPRCRLTLKFPNWYDHYQDLGYDVVAEGRLFPSIWVGTETRDFAPPSSACKWAAGVPATLGAFNLRWHAQVHRMASGKPPEPIGAWYDALCSSPAAYLDQARQAVLAGAPEHLLWHFGNLAYGDASGPAGIAAASALRAHLPELHNAHAALHNIQPLGVTAYKPVNSHGGCTAGSSAPRDHTCEGEAHVFDFVTALGVPLLPTPIWPPEDTNGAVIHPSAAFFSVHALADTKFTSKLELLASEGTPTVLTDGLMSRLPPLLVDSLLKLPTVHVLKVNSHPQALLSSPDSKEMLIMRDQLLLNLGIRLEVKDMETGKPRVPFVAFYPYADGSWVLMNLGNASLTYTVTLPNVSKNQSGTLAAHDWVVSTSSTYI
jgi:hypothetical protein